MPDPYLRFEPAARSRPWCRTRRTGRVPRSTDWSSAATSGWIPTATPRHSTTSSRSTRRTPPVDVRHVAPPKASFDLAEKHGMFDLVMGSDGSPPSAEQVAAIRDAYEVARREKGSFDDPDAPGAQVVALPSPDGAPGGRYVLHQVDQLELPYLPDPLATGAIFWGLPGVPPT